MKRIGHMIFFLSFFILISSISLAETSSSGEVVTESFLADEMVIEMVQAGRISFDAQGIKEANVNITVPQDDSHQDVSYSDSLVVDDLGNRLVSMNYMDPSKSIDYEVRTTVKSSSISISSLPEEYTVPSDAKRYLESTENIQSDDQVIGGLADNITEGAMSDFGKVARIAIWVNENMEYDERYGDTILDARKVLDIRRGVCAEYTTLFVALARASGIPAKYVSSYAYGDNGWEPHAYSEVYIGEWVPVDALWLEVGYLDATHIKFTEQMDNKVANDVNLRARSIEEIMWVKDDMAIDTRSVSYWSPAEGHSLHASTYELAQGDDVLIYARFRPEYYGVMDLDLEPCKSRDGLLEIEDKDRKIIITPDDKEVIVYWIGHVNEDVMDGIIYTCPVTLNSRYLDDRSMNLTIRRSDDKKSSVDASLLRPVIIGDDDIQILDVKAELGGGPKNMRLGTIYGNDIQEVIIDSDSSTRFEYSTFKQGSDEVAVYSSDGFAQILGFEVMERGNVSLDVEYPGIIRVGTQAYANITVVNNRSIPMSLMLKAGDSIESIKLGPDRDKMVSIELETSSPGSIYMPVSISSGRILDIGYIDAYVFETPFVSYSWGYDHGSEKLILSLRTIRGVAENITLHVGDQRLHVNELSDQRDFEFDVPVGSNEIGYVFYDKSGEIYSAKEDITVQEESFIDRIIRIFMSFLSFR